MVCCRDRGSGSSRLGYGISPLGGGHHYPTIELPELTQDWEAETVENAERDGNIRPPDLPLEKSVMQVMKQQFELGMEQQTVSK